MTTLMPTTSPGIQAAAAAAVGQAPSADVTVETISGPSALDTERMPVSTSHRLSPVKQSPTQKIRTSPVASVFVADDNPHVHRIVEETLQAEGHEVSGTLEGAERWKQSLLENPTSCCWTARCRASTSTAPVAMRSHRPAWKSCVSCYLPDRSS